MSDNKHPLNNSKLYLCKYSANIILMLGDMHIELDHSNILSIEYLNDYEFNIRAVLKVGLRIDIRRKIWILKNKRDIVAKFELTEFGMDTEEENYITTPRTVWNQEFSLYFNDEDESTDVNAMEERIAKNEGGAFASVDISEENYYETQNLLDIYLFDQKFLNASAKIYNGVFTNNTLQTCVGRLITETKHDRVLMSRFENDEIYEELLVPANPAYKALIYLDQYYGFYKTGAMIYYDVDTLYILNTNGKLTAKKDGEWAETTIFVTALDLSTPGNGMFLRDGEMTNYCSINEMNINPQKFSIGDNAAMGSEAKIVVTDDVTIDIASANQSYIDQRNERISYMKKTDNKFSANIARARMEENECVLYISAENLDIRAFTPNKEFQVVFDETVKQEKYGKDKYRLSYAYHYLKLQSDNYFTSSHQIALKKRASDEGATE